MEFISLKLKINIIIIVLSTKTNILFLTYRNCKIKDNLIIIYNMKLSFINDCLDININNIENTYL